MGRGSVATDGRFAYFNPNSSTQIYQYEYSREKWVELPKCPYQDSGLAIIKGDITTIGGRDETSVLANKFMKLRRNKWVEAYPPMEAARYYHAVLTTSDGNLLFVIGGIGDPQKVEVFKVRSKKWYRATNVPNLLDYPSATIHGDQLTVIGYCGTEGYSCTIPSGDQLIQSPLSLSWNPLPTLPVVKSTPSTLCGQLVLVGGRRGVYGDPVDLIHQLVNEEWVEIGTMTRNRWDCFIFNPSPDKIIVVGGIYDRTRFPVSTIEEFTVT